MMFDDVSVKGLALALGTCSYRFCTPVNNCLDPMLHVFLQSFLEVSDSALEITLIDGPD